MEKQVTIPCGEITLDGRFNRMEGEKGALIAHPHPLYGGDMHNHIVTAVMNAYVHRGFSTLRFNFRGVGASQGIFDNGVGEQSDIQAGIDFLKAAGIHHIDLAGYSFGAWVISARSLSPDEVNRMLLVSPPVTMMDFSDMRHPGLSIQIITGERDDIAPPDAIEELLDKTKGQVELTTIEGADHFFSGYMQQLEMRIDAIIAAAAP